MKDKLIRFMAGRYGIDSFGKFTIFTGLIAALLSNWMDSFLLSLLAWFLIIYSYYRMFSRNTYKRATKISSI